MGKLQVTELYCVHASELPTSCVISTSAATTMSVDQVNIALCTFIVRIFVGKGRTEFARAFDLAYKLRLPSQLFRSVQCL